MTKLETQLIKLINNLSNWLVMGATSSWRRQSHAMLYYIILYYIILYYDILYDIILYYITLYYIIVWHLSRFGWPSFPWRHRRFYYKSNNLRFRTSPTNTYCAFETRSHLFAPSEIMRCRLLKRLLDHLHGHGPDLLLEAWRFPLCLRPRQAQKRWTIQFWVYLLPLSGAKHKLHPRQYV